MRTPSSANEPEPAAGLLETPAEQSQAESTGASPAVHSEPTPSLDPVPEDTHTNADQSGQGRHLSPDGLSLEQRVSRLEDVIANLQQAHPELLAPLLNGRGAAVPGEPGTTEPPLPPPARPSLLFEVYAELRCIVRMIVDPRYRMSWTGKIMPVVFIFLLILSWWVISEIPIVGGLLDRTCSLVLTYFLFKVLGREATRYRQTSPDLPPALRL